MRIPTFLVVVLVGLVPIAVFASLFIVPANVKWQPPLIWQTTFGTPGLGATNGINAVATDKTGVYAVGYLGQPYGASPTPSPSYAFLKKFDFNGRESWSQQLGNLSSIEVDTVIVGSDGLYLSGIYWANLTVFLEKHDFNGNKVWTSYFGNISIYSPWGVSTSPSGLYVAGLARGPGTITPVPLIMRNYDPRGNVLWTKSLTNETFSGPLLVFAAPGSVFVAGSGPAPTTATAVDTHAYIARYDNSGNPVWYRQFDALPSFECACVPYGLTGDTSGIYVGGVTYDRSLPGETSFGYGGGSFLRKYDWSGNTVWTNGEAGSSIGKISINQSEMYAFAGGLVRLDAANGNLVWAIRTLGQGSDFAVGDNGEYVGGSVIAGANTNALLVAYAQSASLVIGGVNPPYSFIILGAVVGIIPLGILSARWRVMKSASRTLKVSISRFVSMESRKG